MNTTIRLVLISHRCSFSDFVLPPLACASQESSCLRDSVESCVIPSNMQEVDLPLSSHLQLSYLLHASSLDTTLDACKDGCLYFSVNWVSMPPPPHPQNSTTSVPYRMLTLSIPINMEYVSYFLVDCECARNLWDPQFLYAKEIERMDQNNSIFQLFYKPIHILDYPWYAHSSSLTYSIIKSSPRSFTVWRHFQFDEKANAYFVFFSSTSCPSLTPSPVFVEGEMRLCLCSTSLQTLAIASSLSITASHASP